MNKTHDRHMSKFTNEIVIELFDTNRISLQFVLPNSNNIFKILKFLFDFNINFFSICSLKFKVCFQNFMETKSLLRENKI